MYNVLERLLTDIFKGIIYSLMLGVLGAGIGFLLGWPLLKGAYMIILVGASLVMVVSIVFLIGSPKSRMEFMIKGKVIKGKIEKFEDEKERNKDFSSKGISPVIISIVMIIIGFLVEALMH